MVHYFKSVDSTCIIIDFKDIPAYQKDSIFSLCGGLLFTGGPDVDPSFFGQPEVKKYCSINEKRDTLEKWLFSKATQANLPMLGICRGMQHLNVLLGGTLFADLPLFFKQKEIVHRDPLQKSDVWHPATCNSVFLTGLLEKKELTVNSYHHQGIDKPAPDITIAAHSPDGLPEAFHWVDLSIQKWIVGVQWHPERMFADHPEQLFLARAFLAQFQ
jgi:putative glutamine amidotransferase